MKSFDIESLIKSNPTINQLINKEKLVWLNPNNEQNVDPNYFSVTTQDMMDAEALWKRFAPFLKTAYPELQSTDGIIESPLKKIDHMKKSLVEVFQTPINGDLYLKCDNELPIAGSVKARGGFFEVLHYAESLVEKAGLLDNIEDYSVFAKPTIQEYLSNYSIGVGSTGNLGLSIGLISQKLGFNVSVYMSADAKQWKKDFLRSEGVNVHEFAGDFSEAIETGRKQTNALEKGYFVDDEDSKYLFLGYSTAALRLKEQINEQQVIVDEDHPLFFYLPCGVGGAPGGITFGLKQVFGEHVHCFFVEPTHSPAVLLGLLTSLKNNISVQDIGLDNKTEADGLAVGRPSKFASEISEKLVSGLYTIEDDDLFQMLTLLADNEQIFIEPSATAGLFGPQEIGETTYYKKHSINPDNITHIAWSTGGDLVPKDEMDVFYKRGKQLL